MAHLAVPQVSFTIEYKLKSVLDITDDSVMATLETSFMELTGKWTRYLADSSGIAPTQELACYAYHDTPIQALKVPTQYVSETSKHNWVIFPDKVQADSDCSLNVVFPNDCLDAIDGLKSGDIDLQLS